jgi:hypothetical protein
MKTNYLKTVHNTAQGERMLISQMETRHLLNTIRLGVRKMKTIVSVSQEKDETFRAELYGKQTISPKEGADLINAAFDEMSVYFVEIFFRFGEVVSNQAYMDLYNEIQRDLAIVFMREGQLERFDVAQLSSHSHSLDADFFLDEDEHVSD